ncbi:MAG: 50S ribosomal protein L4 [Patescibacteria group bacterium]|jgi:large subunit ribosomal protein L4
MSLKIKVYNQSAEPVKDLTLSKQVFALEPNQELIHQVMVAQMANSRQVLAHTKDRSEVSGGGRKPWKQKGTGRARAGSSRSPIWIGGGVTFGPTKDRNFKKKINKKMNQQALMMALSDKAKGKVLIILENLELPAKKTKGVAEILQKIEQNILKTDRRDWLIVNESVEENAKYAARNLSGVKIVNLENINLLDLLKHRNLLITEKAVQVINERYQK